LCNISKADAPKKFLTGTASGPHNNENHFHFLSGEHVMYICLCKGISEAQVRELGQAGICSPDALAKTLGLKEEGVCGRCIRNIEALVALATREATLRGRSALFGKPD
jgi:bacterioferritin-associated ferredoxin